MVVVIVVVMVVFVVVVSGRRVIIFLPAEFSVAFLDQHIPRFLTPVKLAHTCQGWGCRGWSRGRACRLALRGFCTFRTATAT